MPYIKKEDREEHDRIIGCFDPLRKSGELNYIITKLCLKFVNDCGGQCYDNYNAVVGVLECAKLEMYRRRISTYENVKSIENGDVY